MKSPQQVLTIALALMPLAAAWSDWLPKRDSLYVRANGDSSSTSSTSEATVTPTPTPGSSSTAKQTGSSSAEGKTTTTIGSSTKGGKTTTATHTSFNAEDPAGGVTMVSPAVTAAESYYRLNNPSPITWIWNYTSLQGPPSAIDVMISCSTVTESWTLTQNMSYAPTATFTWNINDYQQKQIASPLPVAEYTLVIYDADGSPTQTAEPGYLAPYSGFKFGLYTPQPYTNESEWQCYTCNSGAINRQALSFAFGMVMITIFTFTYYVTGALV
ncbi:hypothetical protein F5Y16DRAFT_180128 [Xylariaceae sp. FL0255]|nr:hypothetical protein F5Y16DRAFT_180128 [Xylariaceae sp. FL0255]